MTHRRHDRRALGMLIALLGLLLVPGSGRGTSPSPPVDPSGDDLFLMTASTAPNVVLLMDNSKSMNHIEWHPAFNPNAGSYGCSHWDNSQVFRAGDEGWSNDPSITQCGNTRTIYTPAGDDTLWDGRYLNWYFSDGADAYVNEIETAVANVEGCTQAGGAKFFDEKYRRTRLEASKQVLLDLLCVAESKNVRFALAWYREPENPADKDPNGGYLAEDLGRSNPNHAAELEAAMKNTTVNDDSAEVTPLSESLFQVYTYWMSRDVANVPTGRDGVTKFPIYQYDKFGNLETNPSNYLEDTLLYDCEKAFVVIVTDGLPTRDDFDVEVTTDEAAGFADFDDLIGDYHDEGNDGVPDAELPGGPSEASYYLDDIAMYMNDHDFRPDLGGDQTVDTYAVGLATDQTTDDFLAMTAEVGDGLFFHVKDGDELAYALIATLNDIIEKAASFTAAAVPSARTVDGGDFYQSYFFPSGKSAFWEGHVRAWHITATGDIVDANADCALEDPTAGECNSGPFKPEAVYFWDAAEEVPQPVGGNARTLWVSKLAAGESTRVEFDTAHLDAADLDVAQFTAPPDPSPNSALYPVMGSTALNEEGLADEIVQFARGCFFGTGVETADVSAGVPCAARPARLGDIFHSNPIVVRQPKSPLLEPSYRLFKEHYASRSRVIYAGTNAGFLEAFDAGTWQPGATPPSYNAGTGEELFGFMPWEPRLNIENLPIDSPSDRSHYVDGSPQVADIWTYPAAGGGTTSAAGTASASDWRTMLVGGLRRGGRHYYALDITNPDGIAPYGGGTALEYPGFQANGPARGWEFPKEGDPGGYLSLMGLTWGQPIITRVKVSVNNDGVAHERWVAIVTAGYDKNGDPNPQEVTGHVRTFNFAATNGRAIFMIDMKTGGVLARKKLDLGASDAQQAMFFAMPSTPAVFDLNNDGFADVIYVANLGGAMFKWVVKPLGGDPINGSHASDDPDQPNWPFKRFFRAPVFDDSGTLYFQNVYFPPAGAMLHGKLWLAFGAGERKDLSYEGDAGIDENNRFYVVSDPDPLELGAGLPVVTEADLIDATNSPGGVTITSERGFFIKGDDGEKFVTSTVIFAGKVITASFIPTPSADPCAARGDATAYVFDLLTGEGYFRDASNNPLRTLDIGVGLPTDPKVSVGPGGKGNRVYIEKSGADLESLGQDDVPAGGQLLYWRELR